MPVFTPPTASASSRSTATLQDNPAEIANLLAKLDEGFDVVSGWKRERHDPWHKVLPSRVFNWLVSRLMGVHLHDHNCGLKAYRREVMHEIRLYGELHRFVPVLAAAKGFRVGEVVVGHRPRKFGKSKYGVSRLTKGLLDLLTVKFIVGYGQRPQHMLGTVGLFAFLLGGLGMSWLALRWVLSRIISGAGRPSTCTRQPRFTTAWAYSSSVPSFCRSGYSAK